MKHTLFERIRVNRPVVDCFNYLRDFSTIPQWDPGVFSAEKLTPGPVRARAAEHSGTEYQLVFHIPKRKLQMRYEQLEAEPNKRLVLSGYSLPLCGNGESSKPGALSAYDEICFDALSVSMAANDAMTTTRIRKYDLERLKGLALARESNWEVIQRLIDEYMARRA